MKQRKLISVVWADAYGVSNEWEEEEEICTDIAHVQTVGYLLRNDKEAVSLASTLAIDPDGSERFVGVFNIPKGCVIEINKL